MRYIDVQWKHEFNEEPVRLVCEIDLDDFEIRKLEFYPDGSVGFAFETTESLSTMLGIDVVPPLDEINSQDEFKGVSISKEQFELLWQENVPSPS